MKAVLFSPFPSLPFCISQAEEEKLLLTEAEKGCEMHSAYSSQLRKQAKTRTPIKFAIFRTLQTFKVAFGKSREDEGEDSLFDARGCFCAMVRTDVRTEERGKERKIAEKLFFPSSLHVAAAAAVKRGIAIEQGRLPSYSFPCQPGSYAEKERGWVGFARKIGRPKKPRAS